MSSPRGLTWAQAPFPDNDDDGGDGSWAPSCNLPNPPHPVSPTASHPVELSQQTRYLSRLGPWPLHSCSPSALLSEGEEPGEAER